MNVIETIDKFISEIRARPEFSAGVAANPHCDDDLDAIAFGLRELYRLGNTDGRAIDFIDEVQRAIEGGGSLKERLLAVGKIATRAAHIFGSPRDTAN
jgi:hypothetical protein